MYTNKTGTLEFWAKQVYTSKASVTLGIGIKTGSLLFHSSILGVAAPLYWLALNVFYHISELDTLFNYFELSPVCCIGQPPQGPQIHQHRERDTAVSTGIWAVNDRVPTISSLYPSSISEPDLRNQGLLLQLDHRSPRWTIEDEATDPRSC